MKDPNCIKMAPHERHLLDLGPLQGQVWCEGTDHEEAGVFDVAGWWRDTNRADHEAFVPKFEEYGSEDLLAIGRNLADMLGREVSDEEANELGIYFYLEGKLARWREAIRAGRPVSDDTLHDVTVYSMMARLNRAGGMV